MSAFNALLGKTKPGGKTSKKSRSAFGALIEASAKEREDNIVRNSRGKDISNHVFNPQNPNHQLNQEQPKRGILRNLPGIGNLINKISPQKSGGMKFEVGAGLDPKQAQNARAEITRQVKLGAQPKPQTPLNMDFPGALKEGLRAFPRAVVSLGLQANKADTFDPITSGSSFNKLLLGSEPIKPIGLAAADRERSFQEKGFGKFSTPLAIGATTAQTALDLAPAFGANKLGGRISSFVDDVVKPRFFLPPKLVKSSVNPTGIINSSELNIIEKFHNNRLQIEQAKISGLLPAGDDKIYGVGFSMADTPDKEILKITRAKYKATQDFTDAVLRYNKNPIASNLQRVQKARETMKSLDVKPTESFLQPQPVDQKLLPSSIEKPTTTVVDENPFKQSLVGRSIEENAIASKLVQSFPETAGYEVRTVADQAQKVAKLIDSDISTAKRIVSGAEPVPDGMSSSMFIKGMEEYAIKNGDAALIQDLANSKLISETSLHAQELRFLAERNPSSPVAAIQKLTKIKEEAVTRKLGDVVKLKTQAVKTIRSEIKAAAPKPKDWASFVETLKCK